jgi:hypothetical protein
MYVFFIHSLKVFLKEQKMYCLLSVMFTNKEICKNIMNVLVLNWGRFFSASFVRSREAPSVMFSSCFGSRQWPYIIFIVYLQP